MSITTGFPITSLDADADSDVWRKGGIIFIRKRPRFIDWLFSQEETIEIFLEKIKEEGGEKLNITAYSRGSPLSYCLPWGLLRHLKKQ